MDLTGISVAPSLLFSRVMTLIDLDKIAVHSHPMRAQVAVVRAIAEEVERRHPGEECVPELHGQLGEELERLASLGPPSVRSPDSAIDVLLVDDDEASRLACAKIVEMLGHPCRVAHDAESALEEHRRAPAAIVLSDWAMPGKSGLELAAEMKALENAPYFILATAFHENQVRPEARSAVDAFLHKPLAIEDLEKRLLAASRLIRAKRMLAF